MNSLSAPEGPLKLWGVWFRDGADWAREYKYGAILAFESERDAEKYAANEYGHEARDHFGEALSGGWCEVRAIG